MVQRNVDNQDQLVLTNMTVNYMAVSNEDFTGDPLVLLSNLLIICLANLRSITFLLDEKDISFSKHLQGFCIQMTSESIEG